MNKEMNALTGVFLDGMVSRRGGGRLQLIEKKMNASVTNDWHLASPPVYSAEK